MRPESIARPQAEALAVSALAWMAGDADLIGRFLAATGAGPGDLRTPRGRARIPGFCA